MFRVTSEWVDIWESVDGGRNLFVWCSAINVLKYKIKTNVFIIHEPHIHIIYNRNNFSFLPQILTYVASVDK